MATARTSINAPGGSLSYTDDFPLTILVGAPRTYTMNTVDTSGWAPGVYTVTVEILDDSLASIPDGVNYGYLGVGQGLGVSHGVSPNIGAPGTITVTTSITTTLLNESIFPPGQGTQFIESRDTSLEPGESPPSTLGSSPCAAGTRSALLILRRLGNPSYLT